MNGNERNHPEILPINFPPRLGRQNEVDQNEIGYCQVPYHVAKFRGLCFEVELALFVMSVCHDVKVLVS